MYTMWYQPELRDLARALYSINEMENAGRSLILTNGQTSEFYHTKSRLNREDKKLSRGTARKSFQGRRL